MELLTACATTTLTDSTRQQLTEAAPRTSWETIPKQAEKQGLSPLLYHYLKMAQIEPPLPIKRELQGLYLRHQHAFKVRQQLLTEILTSYEQAGIQAILLKGVALAYLVYPQAHLRPMRDMDILVKADDAREAQRLLGEIGFDAPVPEVHEPLPDKHLVSATRYEQGMTVSVEIHHNLFNHYYPVSMTMDTMTAAPLPFSLNGKTAYALGYEDMLWHLCQHVAYHANVWEPIRLAWVADTVGFAEKFQLQVDWQRVARDYPLVLSTLSLFHFITPLSPSLQQTAGIRIGNCPQGVGEEFKGWPRTALSAQQDKGYRGILYDTFFPSAWWLRLHYGLDSATSLWWYRWIRHPAHIFGRLHQLWQDRR